jgi:hypothetical protein
MYCLFQKAKGESPARLIIIIGSWQREEEAEGDDSEGSSD